MSNYDELLDAMDAYREARDKRVPYYDPCGDAARQKAKTKTEAKERLDAVFAKIVRRHAPDMPDLPL